MTEKINNDGYYQDTDDAQLNIAEHVAVIEQTKPYQGAAFSTVERYASISHLTGAKYKNAQDKIHEEERKREVNSYQNLLNKCTSSQTVRCCMNNSCKLHFIAKKADVKRGWAKFCSKSCKAQKQHWS